MDRNAYAFDKVVDLAHQYGIYLRLVISQRKDALEDKIGYDGEAAGVSGTISVSGFTPGTTFAVQWWDTYAGTPRSTLLSAATAAERLCFACPT